MVRSAAGAAGMNLFVCLVNPSGERVPDRVRERYAAQRCWQARATQWHSAPGWAALASSDSQIGNGPQVTTWLSHTGVGIVRLDNREEIARRVGCRDPHLSDMELVTRLIAEHGGEEIRTLLGDFSFVIWDHSTRTLIAACDAFAIRKLYYAEAPGLLAFASRAELLADDEKYDVQYLAEVVAYAGPRGDRTAYRGVTALPAAGIARLMGRQLQLSRFWSAYDYSASPSSPRRAHEQIEECRELMMRAVASCLTGERDVWSYLSGGLDSSSVVSVAQWMAESGRVPQGLGGTITWVDSHGTGADEREYSDSVVGRYGVRNEQQVDYVPWQDDGSGPPLTDLPVAVDGFHARYRREGALMRQAGGYVLLTGLGGDNLFTGDMVFFADWLATGQWRRALGEMARRAAQGRVSFWELAYKNALRPLLPLALQRLLVPDICLPAWMPRETVRQFGLRAGAGLAEACGGSLGHKYRHALGGAIGGMAGTTPDGISEDLLDVRHPFAYRPLVEFALQLPPEVCARPQARKWILREAMRGILPEKVRTRVGKGMVAGVMSWSLVEHRERWQRILRDPILADMGCMDPKQFRAAFAAVLAAPSSSLHAYGLVQHTLCVEAWLQARDGRWTAESGASCITRAMATPRTAVHT